MSTSRAVPDGLLPGGRFDAWDPKRVEYLVADADGTLVGGDGGPSARVVAAVADAAGAGLAIGVATGRMRQAAEPLIEVLGATGPHILHNGAEVRDGQARVAAWPLTDENVETVLTVCRELGVYAEIYLDEGYLVTARDERARPHWDMLGSDPLGVLTSTSQLDEAPLKVTFAMFGDIAPAEVVAGLDGTGLQAGPAGSPITPDIDYVNATRRGADKGRALTRAAEHLGCDLRAITAVGDAPNDIPMLRVAGTAVAMDGAPESVRRVAHLVAPPVGEDGVAVAMAAAGRW